MVRGRSSVGISGPARPGPQAASPGRQEDAGSGNLERGARTFYGIKKKRLGLAVAFAVDAHYALTYDTREFANQQAGEPDVNKNSRQAMKSINLSPLELHPGSPIRRTMPRPPHLRQPDYEQKFDFTTVFYDCFRSADGNWCVLLGPPLINLKSVVIPALPNIFRCQSSSDVRLISHIPGKSRENPFYSAMAPDDEKSR